MSNQIRKLYDNLCSSIKEEISFYEDIIQALKIKQQAIILGEIDKIKSTVSEERKQIEITKSHVEKRKIISDELSNLLELDKATLTNLIEFADEKHTVLLSRYKYQLNSNAMQISKINNDNKYLLSASVAHIRGLVNLFLDDRSEQNHRYVKSGIITPSNETNRALDIQI